MSVAKNGTGTGTVTGSGINCGATCSASYRVGTIVALTAVPSAGYVFYEWSGACSGAGACNVTVNADKSVVATFHKSLYVSLSAAPSSGNHPLTATLTATVSGTAVGTINYTFYCDRNDTGTNITLPADGKYDGQAATTKSHDCVYSSPGVFSPKVIVERDSNVPSATDKKTVTVLNRAPVASNLSAIQPNYCSVGPAAIFSWSFSDPDSVDTQAAYQVQVATNPGFSGPGTVVDTGKVSSASNSYATTQGILSYKTTYYWRARVWDNYDGVAAWAAGASFTTPKHQSPTVNFSWSPNSFSVNEPVQLVDLSQVYGGTTKQSWLWLIPDAAYLAGTNSSSPNPQVKFTSAGAKSVTLTLTDSDGFSCAMAKTLTVRLPLPGWKEIAP